MTLFAGINLVMEYDIDLTDELTCHNFSFHNFLNSDHFEILYSNVQFNVTLISLFITSTIQYNLYSHHNHKQIDSYG
ncbi:MAG: hypothetical protein QMC67_02835 [Candidatus Wallbacteria bacterium]